jgi:hypothetical protein
MLVLKDTIKHDEFFATRVRMGREFAVWRISNNCWCPCNFAAEPGEHASVDPFHGGLCPLKLIRVHDNALLKVCV